MWTHHMDLASIVEDTEQTKYGLQPDWWTDKQVYEWTHKVKPVYPLNFIGSRFEIVSVKYNHFEGNELTAFT